MGRLHIIFDPSERLVPLGEDAAKALEARVAMLTVPDDLEGRDIYEIARKLAELLLEQL